MDLWNEIVPSYKVYFGSLLFVLKRMTGILLSLQLQTDAYYCIRGRVKNEFSFGAHQWSTTKHFFVLLQYIFGLPICTHLKCFFENGRARKNGIHYFSKKKKLFARHQILHSAYVINTRQNVIYINKSLLWSIKALVYDWTAPKCKIYLWICKQAASCTLL